MTFVATPEKSFQKVNKCALKAPVLIIIEAKKKKYWDSYIAEPFKALPDTCGKQETKCFMIFMSDITSNANC